MLKNKTEFGASEPSWNTVVLCKFPFGGSGHLDPGLPLLETRDFRVIPKGQVSKGSRHMTCNELAI